MLRTLIVGLGHAGLDLHWNYRRERAVLSHAGPRLGLTAGPVGGGG